jgi:outer membrane protein assembly factor BamB
VDTGHGNPEVFLAAGSEVFALFPTQPTNASAISWKFAATGKVYGSITSIPGAVVFGDGSGFLYALSSANGNVLLKLNVPGSLRITSGVTAAEGHIFVTAGDPGLNKPGGLFAYTG